MRAAAVQAALVAAAIDLVVLRHAWGSWPERIAVAAAVLLVAIGVGLTALPWLRALAAPRSLVSVAAAAPVAAALGWALGRTHSAQRLGVAAPLLLAAAMLLPLVAAPWLARRRAGALLVGGVGLALIFADAWLPARLYPELRISCSTIGFVALSFAFARRALAAGAAAEAAPPGPAGMWASAAAGVALLLAARALISWSANARFIAHAHAPAAGLVLDGIALLAPSRPAPNHAAPAAGTPAATAESARAAPAAAPSAAAPDGLRDTQDALLGDANLVLVTVDALRADRVRPATMPRLAALASSSAAYARTYAAAPSTAASITALLTGHAPSHLGARPPTLAEVARARGWLTAAFYPAGLFFDGGGALSAYEAARFGFEWADTRTLPAEEVTDAVLARVAALARAHEPRALLWAHYFDPHEPYDRHALPAGAPAQARYDAECAAVDAALARLINGLTILSRPSLVVIAADHGEEFGEHGGAYHGSSLYDEQLRVPLLLFVVGEAPSLPSRRFVTPVSLVDVAPTLATLLGLRLDGDGVDLRPDSGDEPRAHDLHAQVHTQRMLLRDRWKLIHDEPRDLDELYQLDADPAEQRNRFDARDPIATALHDALDQWSNHSSPSQLAQLLADRSQSPAARAAAARELGAREAYGGAAALRAALDDGDAAVRAEAALALGRLSDKRAIPPLRALLDEAPYSVRAALMLGRLRDPAVAPALAALCRRDPGDGDDDTARAAERRDAAHYLGFVGDGRAVDALLAAAVDPRARGSAYVALGRIAARVHDRTAADVLLARFPVEDHADARADLAWALGLAGDARALAPLAVAAAADPPLPRAGEALIRIGALTAPRDDALVGGVDCACHRRAVPPPAEAALEEWLGVTTCTVGAPLALRARPLAGADVVLLRARASDGEARLTVVLDGKPLPAVILGPRFRDVRLEITPLPTMVKPLPIELRSDGGTAVVDHVLLLRGSTAPPLW